MTCGYITINKTKKMVGSETLTKITVLKPPKQLLWSSPNEPYHLTHYIYWSPYLQLQNSKLNLSNFTVTSPFNREINYTCIGWHSFLE